MPKNPIDYATIIALEKSELPRDSRVLLYEPDGGRGQEVKELLESSRGYTCSVYRHGKAWCYKNLNMTYDMVIVPHVVADTKLDRVATLDKIVKLVRPGGELYVYMGLHILPEDIGAEAFDKRIAYHDELSDGTVETFIGKKNKEITMNTIDAAPAPTKNRITKETKDKVMELYYNGKNVKGVADALGMPASTVHHIIKNNLPVASKENIPTIESRAEKGERPGSIAKSMGLRFSSVKAVVSHYRANKLKVSKEQLVHVYVTNGPSFQANNILDAAAQLRGKGALISTDTLLLAAAEQSKHNSMEKYGVWIEKLKPAADCQDIAQLLDSEGVTKSLEPEDLEIEHLLDESPCCLGTRPEEPMAHQAIFNKYPMPLDIVEKVLRDYYEGTYVPEQKRQEALTKIQGIMSAAGLTSEDVFNIL